MNLSLDDLDRDPQRIAQLTQRQLMALMARVAAIQGLLLTQALSSAASNEPDRLIPVKEAAAMLGQDETWIYKHQRTLAFCRRNGASVRCSLRGVREYMERGR